MEGRMGIAKVLILVGSESDLGVMDECPKVLKELGVEHEVVIASAHRTPDDVIKLAKGARERGVKVIIAAAGYAAHLAGAVAANTTLPVVGVPLDASSLGGLDSLLSTVQMPAGIPVAAVTIGKAGAKNAAVFAAEILSTADDAMASALSSYRKKMAAGLAEANTKIKRR
jgi:phosphoribosylaminoimidazole carboxylase PurE protein